MSSVKERYVVDENGNKTGVILDIKDYQRILEDLEELDSVRAYDSARATPGEVIPFEQAIAEIERHRK